jgi:hypothetical protein
LDVFLSSSSKALLPFPFTQNTSHYSSSSSSSLPRPNKIYPGDFPRLPSTSYNFFSIFILIKPAKP